MAARLLNYASPQSRPIRRRRPKPRWMAPVYSVNLLAGLVCLYITCTSDGWGRIGCLYLLDPVVFMSQLLIAGISIAFVLPGHQTPWRLLAVGPAVTAGAFMVGMALPISGC